MEWENNPLWRTVCNNFNALNEYDSLTEKQREIVNESFPEDTDENKIIRILHDWKAMGQQFIGKLYDEFSREESDSGLCVGQKLVHRKAWKDVNELDNLEGCRLYGGRSYFEHPTGDQENNREFSFRAGFAPTSDFELNEGGVEGECCFYSRIGFRPFYKDEQHLPFRLNQKQKEGIEKILDHQNKHIIGTYNQEGDYRKYVTAAVNPADPRFSIEDGVESLQSMFEVIYLLAGTIDEYK